MIRTLGAFFLVMAAACVTGSGTAMAEIQTETVVYHDGDVTLEGFVAWDPEKVQGGAPGVLISHQWMGLTDYEKGRCRQLADLGLVAFALDIYGQGVRPVNPGEAGKLAGVYKADRDLYRRRLNLGLDQLRARDGVDAKRIAAIGYCFGGTGVLELARSGAEVAGVVSFHGGLDSPSPDDGKQIAAKILVCHGADDPFVPKADIEAFIAELNAAHVDWQMNVYAGAVHSFTQPMAGNDNSKGAAYNEQADHRSWLAMEAFFQEIFGTKMPMTQP
ncbi:Dienelactone hydrolase family protein [Rubripirellula lacrimiformis]|uniref:Dienelactone hydrolase family protein n=1 Tax=Rubripirellula lacrimiformis TaxID=1930273 RepID=A0A517N6E5_9BACT|nr:dienelactone hydrolase family protein [Rubripirellula lacrimiformis]QDT02578.1 Dienelactone hydrolase family protein [Rubripirellula lacrimiformis]